MVLTASNNEEKIVVEMRASAKAMNRILHRKRKHKAEKILLQSFTVGNHKWEHNPNTVSQQ